METVQLNSSNLKEWAQKSKPNVMALGFFDGIHKGHKEVINTARKIAEEKGVSLSVMSFFPHPKTVLSNGEVEVDYLMPLSKKAAILEALDVDTFYVVQFDKKFLSLPPEQFVTDYLLQMNVVHAVAGYDFSYGYKGAGKINRLHQDSSYQIEVTEVDKVDFQGIKISSTWIRELILMGEMERLPDILGRYYETKCIWNGQYFEFLPYYMLPAPGSYRVTIKQKGISSEVEVLVTDRKDRIYLADDVPHLFLQNDELEIVWLHKTSITQESYSNTLYENSTTILESKR